jgi:acyl carrier protein
MTGRLLQILAKVFDLKIENITLDLQQANVNKWDSLTHMDLINSLENEFHITLSMEDIVEMTSVGNIISILKNHGIDAHA